MKRGPQTSPMTKSSGTVTKAAENKRGANVRTTRLPKGGCVSRAKRGRKY